MIGIMKQKRLCSLLVATLLLCGTLVSCLKPAIAATTSDQTIAAGIFVLIVNDVFSEASKHEDFDSEIKDVLDNKIEDQPLADWVDQKAKERLHQFIAVNALFDQKELSLSEDDQESIQSRVDDGWKDSAAEYERRGISKQSLLEFEQNVTKREQLFKAYYDKDGSDPASDEDLKALFSDTYIAYYYMYFPFPEPEAPADDADAASSDAASSDSASSDASSSDASAPESAADDTDDAADPEPELTQEQKDAVKKEAEAMLARAKAGEKFTDLVDEHAKKTNPEAPPSADQAPALFRKDEAAEGIGQDLVDQSKIGEPLLLSSDDGYYLFLTFDPAEHEQNFLDTRATLLTDLKEDDFSALLTEEAGKLSITTNAGTLRQFSFKNLVKKELI